MAGPLRIDLEFARAQDAGDPHAFRFAPQTYLVRGRGGDFSGALVEWTRELLADLEEIRLPGRDPAALARVGELLRRILEPAGWREHEAAIVDAIAEGRRVDVTLRSAAAELYALPWELLTLRRTGQSLGAVPQVLLRYEWPATASARPRADRGRAPGRAVLAWSAAGGAVPADAQVAALRAAADASKAGFDGDRDVLGRASYGRLADLLATAAAAGPPIEVLHLLCHGGAQGSTHGLVLDGEAADDPAVIVDPGRLQQLLAPHAGMIRLVVIAACDGGNAGAPGNRLGSAAQMLHRVGIAAVVASRYPLSVAGSTRMSEALYRGLFAGATLEDAFLGARAALARDPTALDWASAQLYARAEDGDATRPLTLGTGDAEAGALAPAARAPSLRAPALAAAREIAPAGGGGRHGLVIGLAALGAAALGLVALLRGGAGVGPPTPADEPPAPPPAAGGATSGGVTPPAAATSTGPVGHVEEDMSPGTSIDRPAAGGATSGGAAPETPPETPPTATKTTTTTKTKKAPAPADDGGSGPAPDPSRACERGLRDYLETRIGAPPGGGVFRVRVKVAGDGAATLASCDGCGGDEAAARQALRERVDPATARAKGKERVPCSAAFDWQ